MKDKHEFRIMTPDRYKRIYFGDNYSYWQSLYCSAEAVTGEEPKQFKENGIVIGLMKTEASFAQAISTMVDEAFLGKKLQQVLSEENDYSECLNE